MIAGWSSLTKYFEKACLTARRYRNGAVFLTSRQRREQGDDAKMNKVRTKIELVEMNGEWSARVNNAKIVAAVGEWTAEPNEEDGCDLVCKVPVTFTDTLRAVVKVESEGQTSKASEYRMYRMKEVSSHNWSIVRSDMAMSWGLDSTTGELKDEKMAISPTMKHAYAAALEMCDRDNDWRDVVAKLCWLCTRESDYYLNIPRWIADLSPAAGMALVRFLDDLLTERECAERAEQALALIGVDLTDLLARKQGDGNPTALADLLEIGISRRTAREVVGALEGIGEILGKNTTWRFPDCVYSSPESRDRLEYLREKPLAETR